MGVERILSELILDAEARHRGSGFGRSATTGLLDPLAGARLARALRTGASSGIEVIADLARAAAKRERLATPGIAPRRLNELGQAVLEAVVSTVAEVGRLDEDFVDPFYERLGYLDLSGVEKALLINLLSQPLDIDTLVETTVASQAHAVIVCTSAALAMDLGSPAHQRVLRLLTRRLGLPATFVETIRRELDEPIPGPVRSSSRSDAIRAAA